VAQVIVATVPIVFAAAMQSPPRFFANIEMQHLAVIGLITTLGSAVAIFLFLSEVGKSTYSPKLHSGRYLLTSTLSFYLLSSFIVYVCYIIFVYPYSRSLVPGAKDTVTGLVIISIYSFALSGANGMTVWSRQRKEGKEEAVREFLTCSKDLRDADLADSEELSARVASSANNLKRGLEHEPMGDSDDLVARLETWLENFEQGSISDRKRMVGWKPAKGNNREDPWKSYYSTFTELQQELRELKSSSQDKK